jgi:protein dithiol oxidoreductase (disulfide-forming)
MLISKLVKSLLVVATMGFVTAAVAQPQPPGGVRDVTLLNPPQTVENDGKVEVLEFFGYGCIHCANLEPRLEAWAKQQPADVKLKRIPVAFASRSIDSIPLFYTLEAMGMQEKLHQKIFDAANVENVILGNPATLNTWLQKQGVDPKKYEEVQKSFSVQNKIARARKMTGDYAIQSTPTIVVNGRYAVQQNAGADRLFANVDQLIAEARASNKASAPTAAPAAATKK